MSTLISLTIALLLAALVDVAPLGAGAASAARQVQAVQQTATIRVMPPIAQPGKKTDSPSGARTVVTASLRPMAAGRPTVLERRSDGHWKAVGEARLNRAGRVSFVAATRVGGEAATYRVRAEAYGALPAVHSKPVRANAWGKPTFVDEFNATALGWAWSHRGAAYNPGGGRSASKGDPSAVRVGGGAARLSVLADPARAGEKFTTSTGSYAYRLNGHISTENSFGFRYGVAAARMKFQRARGQHPSFWMQPQGGIAAGTEVDVVEWFGAQGASGRMLSNVYPHPGHEQRGTAFGGRIDNPNRFLDGPTDTWWNAYHVFSLEWTPQEYVVRIDGHEVMRTSQGVSHDPEFLILSMLSSDYELGNLGGDEKLAQHAFVDWVQVWAQP